MSCLCRMTCASAYETVIVPRRSRDNHITTISDKMFMCALQVMSDADLLCKTMVDSFTSSPLEAESIRYRAFGRAGI